MWQAILSALQFLKQRQAGNAAQANAGTSQLPGAGRTVQQPQIQQQQQPVGQLQSAAIPSLQNAMGNNGNMNSLFQNSDFLKMLMNNNNQQRQ